MDNTFDEYRRIIFDRLIQESIQGKKSKDEIEAEFKKYGFNGPPMLEFKNIEININIEDI